MLRFDVMRQMSHDTLLQHLMACMRCAFLGPTVLARSEYGMFSCLTAAG